jgi:SAM-dependent methyltransferase
VSTDKRLLAPKIPAGSGWALDLGGGRGQLRSLLLSRGYRYANLDLRPSGPGAVHGNAQQVPFASSSFDLVVSCDSLEHFDEPRQALVEVRRVLTPGGTLVVWVPFLHPFHGDDKYRYTPLGLRMLLEWAGFGVVELEAPLWLFSVIAQILVAALGRLGLKRLEAPVERGAAWLDGRFAGFRGPNMSYAAAYLVVAKPCA